VAAGGQSRILQQRATTAHTFFPKEHGATAMLLLPFVCAAILVKATRWTEVFALLAAGAAFMAEGPLVVLARQRFVWKQRRPETDAARRWLLIEAGVLAASGLILLLTGPWKAYLLFAFGAAAFGALSVYMNLHNKQRSEWFQAATAVALTSTSLMPCLAVQRMIPGWARLLWLLTALQAMAGIFVIHARLDARIAQRSNTRPATGNLVAAVVSIVAMVVAAAAFGGSRRYWISAALLLAVGGYCYEVRRQMNPISLRMPMTRAGLQALGLSIVYGILVIAGLW
jgi:hypothetical protein